MRRCQQKRITTLLLSGAFFFCAHAPILAQNPSTNLAESHAKTASAESFSAPKHTPKATAKTSNTAEEILAKYPPKPVPNGWQKISAYTTYFSQKEGGRCANIAIASAYIDGVLLQPYGEFSFNAVVGKRTAEEGFFQAKIIVNGEYVSGIGGGVCQVSTTLYNAALKSGLTVTEAHPHSLQVGYVAPSRDAMVSSHSDLKLFNPHPCPVFLSVRTFSGGVCAAFYAEKHPCLDTSFELTSIPLGIIAPPPPVVKAGGQDGVLRAEKSGMKSELYLSVYQKGALIRFIRLRADEYRPVQGIIVKKSPCSTAKNT